MKLVDDVQYKIIRFQSRAFMASATPFFERSPKEHAILLVNAVGVVVSKLARLAFRIAAFAVRFAFGFFLFAFRLFIGALLRY